MKMSKTAMKSSHIHQFKTLKHLKNYLFKAFISIIKKIHIVTKQGKVLNQAKTYFIAA